MTNNRQVTLNQLVGRSVLVVIMLPTIKRVYHAMIMNVRYSLDYGGIEKVDVKVRGNVDGGASVANAINLLGFDDSLDAPNYFVGFYSEENDDAIVGLVRKINISLPASVPAYTYPNPIHDITMELVIIDDRISAGNDNSLLLARTDERDESIRVIPEELWQKEEIIK